jgi:serine/threonine protein phosphatase 1
MLYAVGDIHGMRDKLEKLLASLPLEPADELVFIGDYVDRGPDSAGVVDLLLRFSREHRCTFLMGNHEAMFLSYLGWEGDAYFGGDAFMQNGGSATLLSYGHLDLKSQFSLPPSHEKFFRGLQLSHQEGQYAFVHAGLSREALRLSDIAYALQHERPRNLLWQRATATLPHNLGVTIIYGHTPMPDMQVRWNLPYSIGIDTGAVYGGPLTAIRLPDETVFQAA